MRDDNKTVKTSPFDIIQPLAAYTNNNENNNKLSFAVQKNSGSETVVGYMVPS